MLSMVSFSASGISIWMLKPLMRVPLGVVSSTAVDLTATYRGVADMNINTAVKANTEAENCPVRTELKPVVRVMIAWKTELYT